MLRLVIRAGTRRGYPPYPSLLDLLLLVCNAEKVEHYIKINTQKRAFGLFQLLRVLL